MTSSGTGQPVLFGASVAGPAHLAQGLPNQDAWLTARGRYGAVVVVSDGLGSRTNSAFGAKQACRTVRQALAHWPGLAHGGNPKDLVRLLESLWRLNLGEQHAEDCAATCRFALREPNGQVLLAALGDGMTLIEEQGELTQLGRERGDAFVNETVALGVPHRLQDWYINTLPPHPNRVAVLTSDGVADDLQPEKLAGFAQWLCDEIAPLAREKRRRRLQRELNQWPVPHHTDDKTVAVLIDRSEASDEERKSR